MSNAPAGFLDKLVDAIVGIEISISRLEDKWKLSQNRSEGDRKGVIQGLRENGTPAAIAAADLMEGSPPYSSGRS